jgi:hypothetical protein
VTCAAGGRPASVTARQTIEGTTPIWKWPLGDGHRKRGDPVAGSRESAGEQRYPQFWYPSIWIVPPTKFRPNFLFGSACPFALFMCPFFYHIISVPSGSVVIYVFDYVSTDSWLSSLFFYLFIFVCICVIPPCDDGGCPLCLLMYISSYALCLLDNVLILQLCNIHIIDSR